jgi:hypothetical protein
MKYSVMFALGLSLAGCASAGDVINLAGEWRLALDREDVGQSHKWFATELPGKDLVQLPGSIQEQGFGDDPGPDTPWTGGVRVDVWSDPKYAPYRTADNFKMPFWLQPDKYYKGAAWFQRSVTIPEAWVGKRITLHLERPHWETMIWVDGVPVGDSLNYLSVPHVHDLSKALSPGKHTITIRVDNRMIVNVGKNSHSVSDHTQSNWNGMIGRLELRAESPVWIDDLQVYPELAKNGIRVVTRIGRQSGKPLAGRLVFEVLFEGKNKARYEVAVSGEEQEAFIPLRHEARPWDEFHPNLYSIKARLLTDAGEDDASTVFGMREIALDNNQIMLNGRRVLMRGTLECCIFPKTGYPPTDVESWKRIIRICKAHGLNHIRFHSWCPPEAAFVAADEMGFYYQIECSSWANQGASLGRGKPVDKWLYDEADAVLKAYGNHPSFLLFACGNEPAGPGRGGTYLRKWVPHYKEIDPRRLVTGGSGWPVIAENDFHVFASGARIQDWGQGLKSRINSKPPETKTDYRKMVQKYPNHPLVVHEIGQWCVYPNFDEIKKYTGVLKPKNFEVFRDFLDQKGLADQAHDFLMASGKLQVLCYKEEIESNLRTPDIGGFQLLDLHDFPGQGTALVGVLDPFWDSKPYMTPEEYNRFCASVVPLARLPKRIFVSSDTLTAQIDVSQFGSVDLENVTLSWALNHEDGREMKNGTLNSIKLPVGDLTTAGKLSVPLAGMPAPAKYNLEVSVDGTDAVNDWDIWVYPNSVPVDSKKVRVVRSLDKETFEYLKTGGKVLLAADPTTVKTDVKLGFSPIFWNTAWTQGQAPHTLGILCDPAHPALAGFPTEYHSNWQWSEPIQSAATMELDHLPKLKPIVQVVPDWFDPKKLGLAFEAEVGGGSLLVCSVDLTNDLEQRPVARQLRHSLLAYMESDRFSPKTSLTKEQIQTIFKAGNAD